jgi:hypothetical protein
MMNVQRLASVAIGLFVIAFPISISAASYSFDVDRLEIAGNLPGSFVDEFDDNSLSPYWQEHEPTVTESGGVVTLSNTGSGSTTLDSTGFLTVQDGFGDFTITSTWSTGLPMYTQQFWMDVFHGIGNNNTESISIGVSYLTPSLATYLGMPTGGPVMFFGREAFDIGEFDFQAFLIDPGSVTGDILLQLTFNDALNQFSGAISLDGGNTYQTPFTPISYSAGEPSFSIGLNAMSVDPVPLPASLLLFCSGLIGLLAAGRKRLFH